MPIEIKGLQISLIWSETLLTLLKGPVPADAPLKQLGYEISYKSLFEQILAIQPYRTGTQTLPLKALFGTSKTVPVLAPPWPKAEGQHFWQRYLNLQTLENVSGSQAWNALVPLRAEFPCSIQPAAWADVFSVAFSFLLESFFYPHGVVFVFTAKCRTTAKALSLEELVKLAFGVRQKKFKIQWTGDEGLFSAFNWKKPAANEMTLDALATRALAANKIVTLGPTFDPPPSASLDPFTILSVVEASVPDPGGAIDEDVQRTIDRVTRWVTNPAATLPPLDSMTVDIKSNGPGRVLYCSPKGRTIWFPDLSTDPDQQHLLRCYHRNLTLASTQVDSLCGIASACAAMLKQSQNIPTPLRICAIKAGGSLGRLYGHKTYKKSYRSMSAARQIEDNDCVADVNLLRQTFAIGSGMALGTADPDNLG